MPHNSFPDWPSKKFILFFLLVSLGFSCENHGFDSDKRQLMAKGEIQAKLGKARSFDITSFKEDTLYADSSARLQKEIRYTLHVRYIDSLGVRQNKVGVVIFTPDGKSILTSEVLDR